MVFLATLHVGGGVCASGKLALADISTGSTSGPFSAVWAVVPPAGFCGVPGLRDSSFRFFPIALRLDGHHGSSSAELPVRFRGDTINIHAWSRGSRGPKIIYWNILHIIYIYMCVCVFIYIYVYVSICICVYMYKYICIYANNLNDPRHYFVIGPSLLFCMDVYDHIINVFPVHSPDRRFLISDIITDWICVAMARVLMKI